MTQLDIVLKAAHILDMRHAHDIVALDLCGATVIADYFVTANSTPQMNALARELTQQLAKEGIAPTLTERNKTPDWILLDFDGVTVHIFSSNMRDFYALDKLWADARKIEVPKEEN
mgnify:CR=1 FL=1